jgi:hypothetical protein
MPKAKKSKKAAAKKTPPPKPKAKPKPRHKPVRRSTKMADPMTVKPAPDPPETDPTENAQPAPPTPAPPGQIAIGDPAHPQSVQVEQPPPNAPDNPGAKTPGPPPPYNVITDYYTPPQPDENTPRSYPVAAGPLGPMVVTGVKTADQLKVELENPPAEEKAELKAHSTGAGPGTGSTIDEGQDDVGKKFVEKVQNNPPKDAPTSGKKNDTTNKSAKDKR